jgi:iron complex transport system substrate-binding protein
VVGGNSYEAALLRDAGGAYVWADDTSIGSMTIDMEALLTRAANAQVWIGAGNVRTLAALRQKSRATRNLLHSGMGRSGRTHVT